MKNLFKNLFVYKNRLQITVFCLLFSAFCFLQTSLFAQKTTTGAQSKSLTKSFSVSAKDILKINTHFAKVTFQEWDKNEVEITATVALNKSTATEQDMESLWNCINITNSQSGKKISYKLTFSCSSTKKWNNLANYMEIRLLVKIPKDIFIDVESSFGDVKIPDVFNDFNAKVDFGDLTIDKLLGNNNTITLNQGKLQIGQVDQLTLNTDFSKVNLQEVGALKLKSSFSTLEIGRATRIKLTSSQDKISIINNIDHIEGEMDFGTLKINSLKSTCVFSNFSFSKITIDKVLRSFTNISISSSQSTLVLNVPRDESFEFNYSGSFTKFKYDNIKLNEAAFKSDNNSVQMSGLYGKNQASGKKITISASFGILSLFE